jgi:DNA-binding FadR family transcriptional regulator
LPVTPHLPGSPSRRSYLDVAHRLRTLLTEEGYRPGDRIPAEPVLLPRLGVGRPLLREALVALETIGWLEVRAGAGMYVRDATATPPGGPGGDLPDLGPSPLEQFECRLLVERELARRAALLITAEELDRLEALVDRMEANFPRDDPALGREFLLGLARASRLKLLPAIAEALLDMRDSRMWHGLRDPQLRPEHYRSTVADRRATIAALRDGDGETASRSVAAILERMREVYFGTGTPAGGA